MSIIQNHEQSSDIEESQVTTVTLLASQGPASGRNDNADPNEMKLSELHRAFSISPTQSTDYIEMSGATGKKMGKAERNLHERSVTSLSSHGSTGGTPKRAKYNPYSYDSLLPSTGTQTDANKDETTFAAENLKPTQESTSRPNSSSGIQKRLSSASNNSVGLGVSCMTTEKLPSGPTSQGEFSRNQRESSSGSAGTGDTSKVPVGLH